MAKPKAHRPPKKWPGWLKKLWCLLFGCPPEAVRLRVETLLVERTWGRVIPRRAGWTLIGYVTAEGGITLMTKVFPGKNVRIRLKPLDADNQPAEIDRQDHPPTWTSSFPAEVEVQQDADGLGALIVAPAGFRGPGVVQASIDADLDAGETRDLIAEVELDYVSGEAVALQSDVTLEDK